MKPLNPISVTCYSMFMYDKLYQIVVKIKLNPTDLGLYRKKIEKYV